MKVDSPLNKLSLDPILVKILSTIEIFALVAGTNEPIWFNMQIRATCLRYVDLPLILGPVINCISFFPDPIKISLVINSD